MLRRPRRVDLILSSLKHRLGANNGGGEWTALWAGQLDA